jgi:hypothetical protein
MGVAMRGDDGICGSFFSYIDLEKRVRADHRLRVIRAIANAALKSLSADFGKLYSPIGRGSIAGAADAGDAVAGVLFDPFGAAAGRAD